MKGSFGYNLFLLKLKTENWKHCSKIIFNVWIVLWDSWTMCKQYVTSAWTVNFVSYIVNLCDVTVYALRGKKKKKKARNRKLVNANAQSKSLQRERKERCKHKDNTDTCYRRGNRRIQWKTFPPPSKQSNDPLKNIVGIHK